MKSLSRLANNKSGVLLNQTVIDTDKFRHFLGYKADRNDYRKPNETFKQVIGALNPFESTIKIEKTSSSKFKRRSKAIEDSIFDIPLWDIDKKKVAL